MLPVLSLALRLAPLVPGLARLLGQDKTAATAERVLGIAQAVTGYGTPEAAIQAIHADPALQMELQKIMADRFKAELESGDKRALAAQETARVEAQSSDEYVRRTRPYLARVSVYGAIAYLSVCGIFAAVNAYCGTKLPVPQEWLLMAIFSPCLSYIGMRGAEAFSRQGKT